jgi:DNA-binding response OmpR family regulator
VSRRVLVVEDERDVAELMRYHLAKEGYEVAMAADGVEALRRARETHPDLVLLDLMIPELDGWEVCRSLKQGPGASDVAVIIVTGRTEEADKVLGLELGADDYIIKLFSPRELLARIRAVGRRRTVAPTADVRHLRVGGIELDRERFEVRADGCLIELTPKEFELLATLMAAPGRVFRRDELLDRVWKQESFVEPRTVDVHLARLRRKFLAAKAGEPAIEAVRGVGYRFREPESTRS